MHTLAPVVLARRLFISLILGITATVDANGFSPHIFSGLFGSYGVCVFTPLLDFAIHPS